MSGYGKGNENKKVKKHESRLPKFLSSKSDIFPYTQSSSSEDSGQSDYSDKDKGIKRNRPNDSSQTNNRSLLQPPPPPSTNRGRDTNRILENILPTSYPNKKRRVQGYESGYESDTEYEVNKNNSILHGININNNISESSQEDPLSGYSTTTFKDSESSQEDLFLKFWSNKSEYFPYAQPDSYLNTGTSIKRNRPNDSPQIQQSPPLPPSNSYQNNNRSLRQSPSTTQTGANNLGKQLNEIYNNPIQQSPPSLETWKPVNELKSKSFNFNTLNEFQKLTDSGIKQASKFGVKFEIIHSDIDPKTGKNRKDVLGSYKLTPIYVAKGSGFVKTINQLKQENNYMSNIICNKIGQNTDGFPKLHSESAGIADITDSKNPGDKIDSESNIMQYINYYKNQYNEALLGGARLRAKLYVENSSAPPCTSEYAHYQGTHCTPAIYNFFENLYNTTDVDARMSVIYGEHGAGDNQNIVRFGVKGGKIDKKYVQKNNLARGKEKDTIQRYAFKSLVAVKALE